MRLRSGPFPPPFSGRRRRRGGGTIPEEETAQRRTGLGRNAEDRARWPQAPRGLQGLPPRAAGARVGAPRRVLQTSLSPPSAPSSPRFYLRGRIPRPSCCLARRSLPIPACTAPPRRRAGPADQSPAPGGCARLYARPLRRACGGACSVRQETATHAQAHQDGRLLQWGAASSASATNGNGRTSPWVSPPYKSFCGA